MEPIRTCVLGTGLAGLTFHVPFILALPELFSLNAVLERSPKTEGGKLQERFGVAATVYATLDDVLNDEDIELIVIATPNETHYEFAKKSLRAGKHGKRESRTCHPIYTYLITRHPFSPRR
jgi:predicted dehydrogenase